MNRFLPLGLILLCVLAACREPARAVRGSIAVALENGRTFQPAQAPVWLVEAHAAEIHLLALQAELRRARATLESESTRVQADCEAVRSDRRNLNYQGASLAAAVKVAEESGNQAALTNALAELAQCDQQRARLSNKELALEKALAELETNKTALAAQLYLAPWPGTLARTTTDAKGAFVLADLPGKDAVLVAACSLKTENGSETWHWFQPLSPTNSSPLLLRHQNRLAL